jgi:glycosyltransferase involved in cell wall biosynthesis
MKKHILFIVENNTYPSDKRVGPESLVAKKYGFKVSAISPINRWYEKKFEVIDGIEIYRYRRLFKEKAKNRYIFEYLNSMMWIFLLSIRIFIKKPFQIIHGANPPDFIFLVAALFKIFGVKYIFDHHDLAPDLYLTKYSKKKDLFYRVQYLFEKMSCKLADVIISTNETYRKLAFSRHRAAPEKIFVVRNDPDINVYNHKLRPKNSSGNGKAKLLFLGGINSQDGVDILIEALNYLVNHHNEKNFVCNILGRGDAFESVKNAAVQYRLDKYINFTGWVMDKQTVIDYLLSSDICIEPAPYNELNRHSTFIKVMEYMSVGKPIVAFDLKETRYSTNKNAVLVPKNDVKEFAKAIKRLIDDPGLREKIGTAALARIHNELNWENATLNLKKAYDYLNA